MKIIDKIINSTNFGGPITQYASQEIFDSFKQGRVKLPLLKKIGGGGNCVSIAIIKLAIATYGFEKNFKSVVVDNINKKYIINFEKESKIIHLKFDDYELASEKSAFTKPNADSDRLLEIYEFAKFCYAVMAEVKRQSYRSGSSFIRAINDLNKGEDSQTIHNLLYLNEKNIDDISIENLKTHNHIMVWNRAHAVFCSNGLYDEYFEKFETVQPLEQLQNIHGDGTSKFAPLGAIYLF